MALNGVEGKPRVLVLGGVGFIGRNLVHMLITRNLASHVRVIDKVMPQMAWLNDDHKCSMDQIEFRHANLINPQTISSVFDCEDGQEFDYVVNCAAETKYGQSESVYRDGVYKLSVNCAKEAAKRNVKKFLEISSSQLKATEKGPEVEEESEQGEAQPSQQPESADSLIEVHDMPVFARQAHCAVKEDSECEPWTLIAKQKLAVEEALSGITGLNYIVLRPALVYGLGDKLGLTPRLVVGGVYKYLQEKMKMLWTSDLKMNTVHVHDVSRAIWHLCEHGVNGEVYSLADKTNTDQGYVGKLVSEIFDINHDYVGSIVSNVAKLSMSELVSDINDKHMCPWGEACQRDGIYNTPLNPYLDQELLYDQPLYIDGSKIEATGFRYERERLTVESLQEVLDDYVQMGLFPPSLLKRS